MKKKLILVLTVVSAVLMCTALLFACTGKDAGEPEGKTVYDINMKLNDNVLQCTQTATVTNVYKDGLTELTFMLYPNAYSENAVSKAYTEKLARYGGVEITELKVNGTPAEFTLGEDNASITFNIPSCKKGDKIETAFVYAVTLPECNLRLGTCNGYYNLSNFYPQLAVFDGENFRCDKFTTVGDPVVSEVSDFKVNVDIPENLVAACAGTVGESSINDGRKTFTVEGKNMRDFAMVLNESFKVCTGVWNDITVSYYSVDEATSSENTALAVNAIKTFSENFGDYPYKTFTVAVTPFSADGMEFSGLVYIADDSSDFEETIIHETAHQWWYNIVGSDNINSAYLDEGLTTFTTAYYYLLNGNEAKYGEKVTEIEEAYLKYERLQKMRGDSASLAINKSVYEYTDYKYVMLVYYKSSLMFKNLYDTMGKSKFNKALSVYAKENRFRFADVNDLSNAFGKAYGSDMSGLINGWLSDNAVLTALAY